MSHNSQKNTGYIKHFEPVKARAFLLCFAFICLLLTNSALAAVNPGTKTERNPVRVLKSTLSELADRQQAVLDWQTQEYELIFDLPADGWYESLDLFLTAIPEGNVSTTDPITISYNGEAPISLYGQASRFDAHIKLDPSRIRTARNSLKIRYKTPHKRDCLTPEHGKWIIDLGRSKLATKTRSKPRDLQISEFKQRINHPMTAPKRVAIRAFGPDKIGLEALVAQGIAGRMSTLPSFQFTTGNADLEILVGEQDDIRSFVKNKKMLETPITRAFTDTGSRPKLVLTGQTSAAVLALARGFASHKLPDARRKYISLNEFYASPRIQPKAIIGAGAHILADIGDTTFSPSWNPKATELDFNVTNPDSSLGKLTLNIVKSPNLDPTSRLKVRLNNQSIGYTMLDKKQKFVSFDIKPGMFRSASNKITIEPVLTAPAKNFSCKLQGEIPTLMVSNRSKLQIKSSAQTASADLNQFSASGAPLFTSDDIPTAIVLTARSNLDRAASLKFMGYAAQQFGPQFARAEYLDTMPTIDDRAKNILIIGPNAIVDKSLLAAAPSALRLALRGKPTTGPNTLTVASIDRYASDENVAIQRLAQQLSKDARIQTGGIASLFASPYSDKHMIGIITSNRPSQFSKSMNSLTKPGYWNGLQGSVARWNNNTIMMAQTPTVLPASYLPKSPKSEWNKVIAAKWNGSVTSVKAMFNRPQEMTPVTKPVAKISTPVVKKAALQQSNIELRGAIEQKAQLRQTNADKPFVTRAKAAIQAKYSTAQQSIISFRDNDVNMVAVRKWLTDQAHNRNTLMALIILSIALMIGMATPKFDR